ncbi:MAG TPA: hypothetical protein DCK93_00715 [Blastocatellia bacterium]|jgi:hypothetical protein|nr:hypothetical protein [Blastocatellia bacterium]
MDCLALLDWTGPLGKASLLIRLVSSDRIFFFAFEIAFWLFVIAAYLKEKQFGRRLRRKIFGPPGLEATLSVKRGEESWNAFILAYGIASVVFTEVIGSTSAFPNHKTILMVSNLGALLYLSFFNGWFRNRVLGLILKAKTFEEKR